MKYDQVVLRATSVLADAVAPISYQTNGAALARALADIDARLKSLEAKAKTETLRYPKFTVPPGEGITMRKVSGPGEELEYEVRQDKPAPPEPAPTVDPLQYSRPQNPTIPNTPPAPTAPATREPGWYWVRRNCWKDEWIPARLTQSGYWQQVADKFWEREPYEVGPRIEVPKP